MATSALVTAKGQITRKHHDSGEGLEVEVSYGC